jgi:hypothetical protein
MKDCDTLLDTPGMNQESPFTPAMTTGKHQKKNGLPVAMLIYEQASLRKEGRCSCTKTN